jgi:hypothetical protein
MRTQMTPFQTEAITVAAGAGTTWLTHAAALAVAVTPILHALTLLASFVVGLLTAIYTVKKILKK